MIEKITGFKVGEQFFPTIQQAQKVDLINIINQTGEASTGITPTPQEVAQSLLEHADEVVAILTGKPTKGAKIAAPSDSAFTEASQESGIPVKVLRQRVIVGGKTLNDAKTTPYTPRPRKSSSAPAEEPAT